MNKNMALISGCLLLFSTQLLADRPAVSEQNTGPAMQESTAQKSATPHAEAQTEAQTEALTTKTEAPLEEATTQTGDVLELQSGETLPVHVLDFPHRGMSMDNVQKELGEPLEITPAIGDPPITSWSYNDRTVYFEHSKVIHAVSNR